MKKKRRNVYKILFWILLVVYLVTLTYFYLGGRLVLFPETFKITQGSLAKPIIEEFRPVPDSCAEEARNSCSGQQGTPQYNSCVASATAACNSDQNS